MEKTDFQLCELNQYRLIDVKGLDAENFLQGQLTCDVTKLKDGQSTITAHCDPKGKINGLFRLIRVADKHYYLMVRKSLLPLALEGLKKYAVFSKVSFEEVPALFLGLKGQGIQQLKQFEDWLKIDVADRCLLIKTQAACGDHYAVELSNPLSAQHWDIWDMQQGYPILNAEGQGEFIPQALNLQALEQAISFQKGCYIGQETVARAKYRGANKRAMYCFTATSRELPALGSEIEMQLENGWRKTGTVINAVQDVEQLWLQVVLSNQLEPQSQFRLAEGVPLQLQSLPYDLSSD